TDAYSRRCCAFHSITGKGQPFGRKRFHLKVTRLLPSSGKTRTDKSQIVSTKERRAKREAVSDTGEEREARSAESEGPLTTATVSCTDLWRARAFWLNVSTQIRVGHFALSDRRFVLRGP